MDHTSITYLMGPDGKFVQHFSFGTSAETLAKALRTAVNS
jgi:cytochrome oxidase Cu insertion factor (SCO1/SenC/PrrC family)